MEKLLKKLEKIVVKHQTINPKMLKTFEIGQAFCNSKAKEGDVKKVAAKLDLEENMLWDAILFYKQIEKL